MRPVNLIPPEQRRGDRAPLRSGPLSYVVVAVLVVALGAVTAVVLTNNQIADRKSEKDALAAQEAAARERAEELAPYAQFATMREARRATVSSLAQTRFDWERVMRELAIVIPEDVWLTQLTGTVAPDVGLDSAADVGIRDDVAGPALSIVGCGANQEAVARFAAALRDIDGVTRIGVQESKRPDLKAGDATSSGAAAASGGGTGEECRTRDFIARFQIVAAFDEVPAPADAAAEAAAAATTPPTTDDGGVAGAEAQESQAEESTATQSEAGQDAAGVVSGVIR